MTDNAINRTRPPLTMRIYSALLHALPLVSGTTRLSFNRLTNAAFRDSVSDIEATMLDGRTRILVDANDYHGRILYLFGTNDPKVHHAVQALTCPGDVFLDIGANYSTIGLLAAQRVGPEGHVHLFEPQEELCAKVQQAIDQSGARNVDLHRIGLMDRDGELSLSRPEHHSGMATFSPRDETASWEQVKLQVRDVSTYVAPLVEGRRFCGKIDIEGAEPLIMPWLFRQPGLRYMIFEAAHHHEELWQLTGESAAPGGLVLYGLARRVFEKTLIRIDSSREMRGFHDLIAVARPAGIELPETTSPFALSALLRNTEEWGPRQPQEAAQSSV